MTHDQVHFSQLPRVVKNHGYMVHPSALILLFTWGTWSSSPEFSPDTTISFVNSFLNNKILIYYKPTLKIA